MEKHKLPFTLLADEDKSVAEKYGAWGEKNMYGKKSMGVIRSTFVIDEEGVAHAWPNVKAAGHVDQVLEAVSALSSRAGRPSLRRSRP